MEEDMAVNTINLFFFFLVFFSFHAVLGFFGLPMDPRV
jgi:hypothetical protein